MRQSRFHSSAVSRWWSLAYKYWRLHLRNSDAKQDLVGLTSSRSRCSRSCLRNYYAFVTSRCRTLQSVGERGGFREFPRANRWQIRIETPRMMLVLKFKDYRTFIPNRINANSRIKQTPRRIVETRDTHEKFSNYRRAADRWRGGKRWREEKRGEKLERFLPIVFNPRKIMRIENSCGTVRGSHDDAFGNDTFANPWIYWISGLFIYWFIYLRSSQRRVLSVRLIDSNRSADIDENDRIATSGSANGEPATSKLVSLVPRT